jgi:hypothetical protein
VTTSNKRNLLYFEADTMRELYEVMEEWQEVNNKRLLSTNIQQDRGKFCCIALSNPTEVVICDESGVKVSISRTTNGRTALNVLLNSNSYTDPPVLGPDNDPTPFFRPRRHPY